MINSKIIDATGKGYGLKVDNEGAIGVVIHPHPPIDEKQTSLPLRQFFTDDGTSTGSNDMRVNGSVTNVKFYVSAQTDYEVFIKTVNIFISDPGATLQNFGNLSALTNGVLFKWETSDNGDVTIYDGFKTNLDFFRLTKQTAQIIDLSGSGADAVLITIDFEEVFGQQYGLRLRQGSNDNISMTVRDNLSTGIVEYNTVANGIKI